MADYFSEYQSFIGAKGLPTPSDTPYETPGYLRSKRASRATQASSSHSREASVSPPPLPPDTTELNDKPRDGKYSGVDPRRFTPTLHASLVSEILSLRRDLDSKNSLVENLETSLSDAKNGCDMLNDELSSTAKEARHAKQRAEQLEKGTDEIVTELTQERDAIKEMIDDLKSKLDVAQKKVRRQDEDAVRTQAIWEQDKDSWENERRQLEHRIHVTESRLRSFVDEMTSQQAVTQQQPAREDVGDDGETFKDSGVGAESDTTSVRSTPKGRKHRRNMSSLSYRSRSLRTSSPRKSVETHEPHAKPNGFSLADELGIDEEDEYDLDDFDEAEDEINYPSPAKRFTRSWSNPSLNEPDLKAKRVLGLASEASGSPQLNGQAPIVSQKSAPIPTSPEDAMPRDGLHYVDTGYQPSPPQSPPREAAPQGTANIPEIKEPSTADEELNSTEEAVARQDRTLSVATKMMTSPISPPETPVSDQIPWHDRQLRSFISSAYVSSSTQTEVIVPDIVELSTPKRNSLSPPCVVPSIAIHPPNSRPSSPRTYVLPPGTKNATTQASLPWRNNSAATQTEGIRVDKRGFQMPPPEQSSQSSQLLPSPEFEEPPRAPKQQEPTEETAKIFRSIDGANTAPPSANESPTTSSPNKSYPTTARTPKIRARPPKNLKLPLRPLPLPRPVLSPPADQSSLKEVPKQETNDGPLNRSSQYGVTKQTQASSHLAGLGDESDDSDFDDMMSDAETHDLVNSIPATSRPHGRFGLSEPPKVVPEDKEISPERRPGTSGSAVAAPAPSISSSRANSSNRARGKPPAKLSSYSKHSRNPSLGSVTSSAYSTQSALPPFPIPARSSSRAAPNANSEASVSPTPYHSDAFSQRRARGGRVTPTSPPNLRKVQSAAVIRPRSSRSSPQKHLRRRRRSPDLTPIQSMAFQSPQTNFPIPDLPTPLQQRGLSGDYIGSTGDLIKPPGTASSALSAASHENGLVDAIAATMVGEWMFKYIRKRKSFGVGDNENLKPGEDGTVNITGNGVRHKRWVWLSPYERTIMWDHKQPANGIALLGKKGRKCKFSVLGQYRTRADGFQVAIQSVMDVKDDTPLPKDAKIEVPFNRSIIVLTPQRALKFTAPSSERHALWMTALSFLAESDARPLTPANHLQPGKPSLEPEMPTPPPIRMPQHEPPAPQLSHAPRFGRAKLRDSVRLANGRRPSFQKSFSEQPPPSPDIRSLDPFKPDLHDNTTNEHEEGEADEEESAAFPSIPRLYSNTARHRPHQRKRSNTSPRLPQPLMSNLRSFSGNAAASSLPQSSNPNPNPNPSTVSSKSHPPSANTRTTHESPSYSHSHNFFEAVGTVRMEAFVDPSVRDGVLYLPAPPGGPVGSRRSRGDSGVSSASMGDKRRAGYVFDKEGRDPFKGF